MKARDFLEAARVPRSLAPQEFGVWRIERRKAPLDLLCRAAGRKPMGWTDYTLLFRLTEATMHLDGDIVMEDSVAELQRHLPIWMAARGRVLVTGLGLGCVVRGLLASPKVSHVDVVEIDRKIIDVVGPEVAGSRCTIHHADALTWEPPPDAAWDFAWHDLWCEDGGKHLQLLHADLFSRFYDAIPLRRQGAWAFPRTIGRRIGLLGAPR